MAMLGLSAAKVRPLSGQVPLGESRIIGAAVVTSPTGTDMWGGCSVECGADAMCHVSRVYWEALEKHKRVSQNARTWLHDRYMSSYSVRSIKGQIPPFHF